VLIYIAVKGGNDPVAIARVINLWLQQLRGEVEQHCKVKEAEAEAKEAHSQQLGVLTAGARSLEEAMKRRATVSIIEAHKELSSGWKSSSVAWRARQKGV
jgi:hypothetical protein